MLLKKLKCYLDSNTQSSYAHYSSLTSCLDSFALCYIRQIIILLVMVYYPFFIESLAKLYFDHLSSINSLYCLISLLSCVFFFFLYILCYETDNFLLQKWTKKCFRLLFLASHFSDDGWRIPGCLIRPPH